MITISAVSFLATTANKPFSLMINHSDALMLLECSRWFLILLLTNGCGRPWSRNQTVWHPKPSKRNRVS